MDRVRYVAAILALLTVPLALIYWFIVHPFIRFWRKLGPTVTYTVLTPIMIAVLVATYWMRGHFLGNDFGTNWPLCAVGLACFVVSAVVGQAMKKQFTVAKLVGVQEIQGESSPQELVTEGIYARIRHPRYLSVLLGLVGLALMANYFGIYVVVAAFVPGLYAIIILEERELVERFGDAYRDYCKRVPRLIPRLHR
jgi:protein-S-isoprenylcysteine O-methyltransferase Ste14